MELQKKANPQQTMKIKEQDFVNRYYKNENAKSILVLLTGGIGLSDLFYKHFDRLARDFSVITFDYPVVSGFLYSHEAVGLLFPHCNEWYGSQ